VIEEQRWQKLDNGRLVAALVGELLLVRAFHRSRVSGQITLKPEDKSYSEQTFGPRDEGCYIIGPVLSVMRKL
jgi:repressor LexA